MQNLNFLQKIVNELRQTHTSLHGLTLVLPGKRPAVFIKRILKEQNYTGILPRFITIEELIAEISELQGITGIPLWLLSYDIYRKIDNREDLQSFLKWFPTLLKDWDDMLKFSDTDTAILDYMLSEERLKNWGSQLGEDTPHQRNLNFWRRMNAFVPHLKAELRSANLATAGMIYEETRCKIDTFTVETDAYFVFCGFNALSPVEEKLVRSLLQHDKARCFFQADRYYLEDDRQEAGKFLRGHLKWKEFNDYRPFEWISEGFSDSKNIQVWEVPGNIVQTKLLPQILKECTHATVNLDHTAIVLMDENLLPATLESLRQSVAALNITMGFPLKNLSFSSAIKKLFHLQKQLVKNGQSYYHADLIPVLEELCVTISDQELLKHFNNEVQTRNLIYISPKILREFLEQLSFFSLLLEAESPGGYLQELIDFCEVHKGDVHSDIDYENISVFEKVFVTLKNQFSQYDFLPNIETLEVLINQLVSTESIDFEGEPLAGLQVMGLLETRLLDFENVIMVSVNEGKIPLGKAQNTLLPFDVRAMYGLNTFLENDSIYAYHFYRLIQEAKNVYMLYSGISEGLTTGERSRFISQIELESGHPIKNFIVDNSSQPLTPELIHFAKTPAVLAKLDEWKKSISPSHLTNYLHNPISFYLEKVLKVRQSEEIEEELSALNFGNLVHGALEYLYQPLINKPLQVRDLRALLPKIEDALNFAIQNKLNHDLQYYAQGINYIHKAVAQRTISEIIKKDMEDLESGNRMEILMLEEELNADFILDDTTGEMISFHGFADRIDSYNGVLRIIDYKSGKVKTIAVKQKDDEVINSTLLVKKEGAHAVQLSIYAYCILQSKRFPDNEVQCGIWTFLKPKDGVQFLNIDGSDRINSTNLQLPLQSVRTIIKEILNPEIEFVEPEK